MAVPQTVKGQKFYPTWKFICQTCTFKIGSRPKTLKSEFLLWLRGNEPDWYPWSLSRVTPGLLSGLRTLCCHALGCRPAPVALIWPLAWELSYATHAALKIKRRKRLLLIPQSDTCLQPHGLQSTILCHILPSLFSHPFTELILIILLVSTEQKHPLRSFP